MGLQTLKPKPPQPGRNAGFGVFKAGEVQASVLNSLGFRVA